MITLGILGGVDPVEGELETEYHGLNSEIAEDLITLAGLTPNVVPNTVVISEFKCIQAVIYERLLTLLESVDYQLRYNPVTRVLNYEPRGYIDNGLILTNSDFIGLPEWSETTDGMINNLRIDGATTETQITESGQIGVTEGYSTTGIQLTKTPNIVELYIDSANPPTTQRLGGTKDASTNHYYWVDRESMRVMPATTFTTNDYAIINYSWSAPAPVQDYRQDSIDKYGEFSEVYTFNDITSVADAETRVSQILDMRSEPFKTGILKLKLGTNIQVGELVTINDTMSYEPVSGTFVVIKIKNTYPSAYIEVEVGEKEWKLEDDIIELESRVKRLEEQFIRNQDLLLQLIRVQDDSDTNAVFPTERYLKVVKQEYNTDNNVMIWGSPTHGVWGESNWGTHSDAFNTEQEVAVISYLEYIEDFTDEDFKDSTSDSWGTLTDGQENISTYITYKEKTINSCQIVTESTGDLAFYLDNGQGWELVESTTHTFAESGDYIKWKAVSTGNSTITKITITY